jgi:hypothetical protein
MKSVAAKRTDVDFLSADGRLGHAPMLDEPAAVAAIDAFLKGLETT